MRIEAGQVDEPKPSENTLLDDAQLAQGIRLACQVIPHQDLQIAIVAPAPESAWRSLPRGNGRSVRPVSAFPLRDGPTKVKEPYGAAVDLGTSHVSLSLLDLSNGEFLAGRHGPNPQMSFGSDVMTRLAAASESSERALTMRRQIAEAIGEALWDIASKRRNRSSASSESCSGWKHGNAGVVIRTELQPVDSTKQLDESH